MASAIEVILIPALMILLGVFLKHRGVLSESDRKVLSDIVLYVALPSMIFINLRKANISHDMLFLPVLGLATSLILLAIAYCFCKIRGYSKRKSWTIMVASSIMNTGFIGFPVTLGVFGNEGFVYALFFDLSTTVMVVAYGVILAKQFGGSRREAVKNAVTFIPLWALILGLIFNVFNIPLIYVVENVLDYFAQATIPLIMLALGLSLNYSHIAEYISDSIVVAVIKLVAAPLVIFIMLSILNIKGMAFNVAILEAGMSTAGNALVLAITYDLDEDMMGALIFTNIVLSLFTLTAIITLLA